MEKKKYNDYTKEDFKKYLKPLKGTVKFKILPSYYKEVPKINQLGIQSGMEMDGPVFVPLPTTERVKTEKGKFIDIAYLKNEDVDNPDFGDDLVFAQAQQYIISCDEGNHMDERKYEYLMLMNENNSNPNRDKGAQAVFEIEDRLSKAKAKLEKNQEIQSVMELAEEMTEEEVRSFVADRGGNELEEIEILRSDMLDEIRTNDGYRKDFLTKSKDINSEYVKNIKEAERYEVIIWDSTQNGWFWKDTKAEIKMLPRKMKQGQRDFQGLKQYFLESKDGKKIYEEMNRLVGKRKEEKVED